MAGTSGASNYDNSSPATALQICLKRLLSEGDDSPKSKKHHTYESACSAASSDDKGDESSRAKRVCTCDGGDRHESTKACIHEGAAAIAAAANVEWEKSKGFPIEDEVRQKFALISSLSAIPLPSEDIDSLHKEYIVVQEKDPETIRRKIDEILLSAAQSSLQGEGYSLKIPLRISKNLRYKDGLGFFYRIGGDVKYDFSEDTHKTVVLTCVLSVIAEAIREGITVTYRDLFYSYKEIFGRKAVSDEMIANVCLFRCTKSSLHVVSESKGSVAGNLDFIMKKGRTRSCSGLDGERIPHLLSEIEYFKHEAKFILLVQKKSIFNHLLQMKFHLKNSCIIVTGSGRPDIATRLFLRRLHGETKLPVYAFMDPDPHGIQILCAYAFGSLNMSYDRMRLAVPGG